MYSDMVHSGEALENGGVHFSKSCPQSRSLARCGNPVSLACRLGRQKQKDRYISNDWAYVPAPPPNSPTPLTSTVPSFGLRAFVQPSVLFLPIKTVT